MVRTLRLAISSVERVEPAISREPLPASTIFLAASIAASSVLTSSADIEAIGNSARSGALVSVRPSNSPMTVFLMTNLPRRPSRLPTRDNSLRPAGDLITYRQITNSLSDSCRVRQTVRHPRTQPGGVNFPGDVPTTPCFQTHHRAESGRAAAPRPDAPGTP